MTLKEFADKPIVQTIPSLTTWSSFISLFIFGPSWEYDWIALTIFGISVFCMAVINGIRGIKPPEHTGQSWADRTITDPIYHHLSGNLHHNRWDR